jgi:hypothetical protein
VRDANSSVAGRRNGGAMLMALANEKALLTTLVSCTPLAASSSLAQVHMGSKTRSCG